MALNTAVENMGIARKEGSKIWHLFCVISILFFVPGQKIKSQPRGEKICLLEASGPPGFLSTIPQAGRERLSPKAASCFFPTEERT